MHVYLSKNSKAILDCIHKNKKRVNIALNCEV